MDMQNVIEGIANGMSRNGNTDTLRSFSAYVDSLPVEEGVGPVKSIAMCLLAIATLSSGCSDASKRVPDATDALCAEVDSKIAEISGIVEKMKSDAEKSISDAKAKSDAEEVKRLDELERKFNAIMAQN